MPRAVMSLAICCLGKSRREWALAIQGEFEVAVADGEGFAFAAGCLVAAWREMPRQAEGRVGLGTYALALGLLIPMAGVQFASVFGFSSIFGAPGSDGIFLAGAAQSPLLAYPQHRALPCVLFLWLLLGMSHLRLAWMLVERDWTGVMRISALIAAITATLFIFVAALLLDVTSVILQLAALVIEFSALAAVARPQAMLFPSAALEMPAR